MSATLSLTVSETSTNPSANTSVVKATLKITTSGQTYNEYSPSGYITIDGTRYSFTHGFGQNQTTTLATKSKTVTHNTNGAKSVTVYASFNTGVSAGTLTRTVTKTLTTFTRSFSVTYNANGGSGAPSTQTKTYGTPITLSKTRPTRTGYSFLGWSISNKSTAPDVAYTDAKMQAGVSYKTEAALALYAVWKINTYTVVYNANGGSGAPAKQTKTYGQSITLSKSTPSRSGYKFSGWATSSSGSIAYDPGDAYSANANVTLYAVWTRISYTVTFNGNGATSGSTASQTKYHGTSLTLRANGFTRTNYIFRGWSTSKTATSPTWQNQGSYTTNKSQTLYAVWLLNDASTYVEPEIVSRSVYRCIVDGNNRQESLAGTSIYLSFKWTSGQTQQTVSATTITLYENNVAQQSWTSTSASGTQSYLFSDIPVGETETIKITVKDTTKNVTVSESFELPTGGYVMHIGHNENNVTFFGTADDDVDGVVIGKGDLILDDGTVQISKHIWPNKDMTSWLGNSSHIWYYSYIRRLFLGTLDYSEDAAALGTHWKDGKSHFLLQRADDGLTTYLGWVGSSSYKTSTVVQGYTVDLNSNGGGIILHDATTCNSTLSAGAVTSYVPQWKIGHEPADYHCVVSAGICSFSYRGPTVAHAANTQIGTLASGSRPKSAVYCPCVKMSGGVVGCIRILTTGAFEVMLISDTTSTGRLYFNCTFPVV